MSGRSLVYLALGLGGALFGWWLGEDVASPVAKLFRLAFLLALLVGLGVYLALGRDNKPAGVACVGVAIALALGSWGGGQAATRAFNECVEAGESVRQRLAEYKASHGTFPQELADLPGVLPCRRPFRGTLLEYTPQGGDAYKLQFRDWLVTHQATDRDEFLAVK